MTTNHFQTAFLHFVDFSKFNNWNVKQYVNTNLLKSNFRIEFLAEHLIEQNNKIKPFDFPEKDFAILGVDNKVGIFDAYISKGKEINQPYKKMETGFIAYNPYRINVGSIGLKTEKHQHQYISPAYVVFSCQATLLPEYLFLVFKTNFYNRIIRENTTGSVRQNLSFDNLIKMQIPLPDINTQKALVQAYQDKMAKADDFEKQANQIDSDIEQYLFEQLGIQIQQTQKAQTGKLRFVNFRDLSRWDVNFSLNKQISSSKNYPIIQFGELISYLQYGLSLKSEKELVQGIPFLRMNNIFNSELKIDNPSLKFVEDNELITKHILEKEDFLFNRTNSKELVGKTAVFNKEGKFTFASYLIRVKVNSDKANVFFINELFNSSIVRKQIDLISRQVLGQANINSTELKSFLIPLPHLPTQTQIASYIQTQKQQQKDRLATASAYRIEALMEFEKAIFK